MTTKQSLGDRVLGLESVQSIHNFRYSELPAGGFTLLPFLCPFRYKPYNVVKNMQGVVLGVTTGYRDGITTGSKSKINRVSAFWNNGASAVLHGSRIRFLMGDSDIYACSSIFPEAPALPCMEGMEIVSNKQAWETVGAVLELEELCDTGYSLYSPAIQDAIKQEREEHLQVDAGMYHPDVPMIWKERMIKRIICSYMLDGILMRRGVYGSNPIILGVEASSTVVIQNAALKDEEKIPVILLRP